MNYIYLLVGIILSIIYAVVFNENVNKSYLSASKGKFQRFLLVVGILLFNNLISLKILRFLYYASVAVIFLIATIVDRKRRNSKSKQDLLYIVFWTLLLIASLAAALRL